MRYSLGIMKPDCIERGLIDKVFSMIRDSELKIIAKKILYLKQSDVDIIYKRCQHKEFYKDMSSFLLSGNVCVYVVEGDNAINRLNVLVGETNPKLADIKTIRGELGESIRRNITHSSMNEESFWKELNVFFTPKEISSIIVDINIGEKF